MDTARVDICYRPLRIAWAIRSGDFDALRYVVRLSHTMWGGRFNPIIVVDNEEAPDLVELFRVDVISPVGDSPEVAAFRARFPHLISPFFPDKLFFRDKGQPGHAQVLDIHNALVHWRDKPVWKALADDGLRSFSWDNDDPLADIFLMQLGAYPTEEEVGIDYAQILSDMAQPGYVLQTKLDKAAPISPETVQYPSLGFLSRCGLSRHYTVRPGWDFPGFYVGDASNFDDLVRFWNLRAADIAVQFVDPAHMPRYQLVHPEYSRRLREDLSHLEDHRRRLAIWSVQERLQDALKLFPEGDFMACGLHGALSWKGGAVRPPMMILGEESSLGVLGNAGGQPRVSFALRDKPFSGDVWFHTQHLVASISMIGGLHGNAQHTFHPPYVPELNEFYARSMHFHYDRLRVEPERIGLVIDAADHDTFIHALPVEALAERLFDLCGLRASPSSAGLITRQLAVRLGGVDGARAFKIPGVRRLIRTYGLRASFTRSAALQIIGSRDPDNPGANFGEHERLFIEARPMDSKLTPDMVFAHLVEKGLFRIGAELKCPSCKLSSWIALDQLRQQNVCELCGAEFDATRQLVGSEYRYRRSGVLGLEKNAQGAVPVALLLQQLSVNVHSLRHDGIYLPSFDLVPKLGVELPTCETDFLVILPRTYPGLTQIMLGECKDAGGAINSTDVENMRRIADAFPKNRFDTFVLFAKLSAFSDEEVALARTLNGPYQQRVILLTDRELEPYHTYERVGEKLGANKYASTADRLAAATAQLYFLDKS